MLRSADIVVAIWLASWGAWSGPHATAPRAVLGQAIEGQAALLQLTENELREQIAADPFAIGPLSIGGPGSATLFNAVRLPESPLWQAAPNADTWGTTETMAALETAIDTVSQLFPETAPVVIGDISARNGGRLKRHESHQGGRDVDVGLYYKDGKGAWFTPGTAVNLDLDRNWAFVRALLVCTDVERIFLDIRIQRLLYQHALSIGEDKAWLDRVFQFVTGSVDSIVQHVAGHRTHYHVRFYSPIAQELGRRAHPLLVELNLMTPPVFTVPHVVRAGQTLGLLAARYGTSVRAIMQANGLTSTHLRAGRSYRIPVRTAAPLAQPLAVPPRMLPPVTPPAMSSVAWPTAETLYGPVLER